MFHPIDPMLCIKSTRKCDFSKGPTWLECPRWLRGMVVLIKGLGHEKHELLLIETFY
jgi:hypothetical protein